MDMIGALAVTASQYETWEFWLKIVAAAAVIPTLFLTWWTHRQRSTFEMIDRLYSLCHILQSHMLHEWRISHLFCIGTDVYLETTRRIRSSVTDEAVKAELGVEERQFAIHIFVIYEQIFYQWQNSSNRLERGRSRFLVEMMEYFTDRLLRNPRLMAYFADDPTGRTLHLEACAAEHLRDCLAGDQVEIDPRGPFDMPLKPAANLSFTTVDVPRPA